MTSLPRHLPQMEKKEKRSNRARERATILYTLTQTPFFLLLSSPLIHKLTMYNSNISLRLVHLDNSSWMIGIFTSLYSCPFFISYCDVLFLYTVHLLSRFDLLYSHYANNKAEDKVTLVHQIMQAGWFDLGYIMYSITIILSTGS